MPLTITEAILEADLTANRRRLVRVRRQLDALLAERRTLWEQGRALQPPMSHDRLGAASGVSGVAVIRGMARHETSAQAS